jgi:tRNA dimethylallyltransferase
MSPEAFRNVLILTGPTGSGKSALAVTVAERLGAEIVSMDSMALYRGMDIGTAKPDAEQRRCVPHHLIDVLHPWESASVAWWLDHAVDAVRDIESRGRRALVVGGTPLYLKALLHGLFDAPPTDEELRGRLEKEAAALGAEAFHARLATVDPLSAGRIHPNNVRRVIRALEVWHLTGRPMSAHQTQWDTQPHSTQVYCLNRPRAELYARIDARVLKMIDDGLVEEVRGLLRLDRPLSREASQALGYKEILAFLDGKMTLSQSIALIQTRSRQFAKRQMTWLRSMASVKLSDGELTFALPDSTIDSSEYT